MSLPQDHPTQSYTHHHSSFSPGMASCNSVFLHKMTFPGHLQTCQSFITLLTAPSTQNMSRSQLLLRNSTVRLPKRQTETEYRLWCANCLHYVPPQGYRLCPDPTHLALGDLWRSLQPEIITRSNVHPRGTALQVRRAKDKRDKQRN